MLITDFETFRRVAAAVTLPDFATLINVSISLRRQVHRSLLANTRSVWHVFTSYGDTIGFVDGHLRVEGSFWRRGTPRGIPASGERPLLERTRTIRMGYGLIDSALPAGALPTSSIWEPVPRTQAGVCPSLMGSSAHCSYHDQARLRGRYRRSQLSPRSPCRKRSRRQRCAAPGERPVPDRKNRIPGERSMWETLRAPNPSTCFQRRRHKLSHRAAAAFGVDLGSVYFCRFPVLHLLGDGRLG